MQKKIVRVLHIITRLIAAGADENTLFTVQGIDKEKFESHLLVGGDSEIVDIARKSGVNIEVVESLVRNINPFKDVLALLKIFFFIKKNKYDIVHTHTAKAGFIGRLAARMANVPIIIHTLHGLSFHDFMPRWQKNFFVLLEKFTGKFTDFFISVGKNIMNKSIKEGIGKPENYATIYSGMDFNKFDNVQVNINKFKSSIGLNGREIIVGTVARLEPRKGPHYFIDVFFRVKQSFPNVKAVIVGEGSFRQYLEKKVQSLGLENDIIFTGFRQDIAEVMSIFDVICLTSLWEGVPRVLIQGAKLGKPLVAFDIDGNSEVIRQGKNGWLVPALAIQECAEKLLQVIRDEKLRYRMSEESKKIIDERWDKDYMIKEIERCYLNLCRNKL